VPDIPLDRIKDRLSQVRGALVECPLVRKRLAYGAMTGIDYLLSGLPH
jgi:hypothetical protein